MKIFLATKNEGKIEDFKKLTNGMDIEVVSILVVVLPVLISSFSLYDNFIKYIKSPRRIIKSIIKPF